MSDFPAQAEDLSEAWLSEALGRRVTGFRVRSLGEGVGVIGQVRRIELDSEPGRGTRFIIAMPRQRPAMVPEPVVEAAVAEAGASPAKPTTQEEAWGAALNDPES